MAFDLNNDDELLCCLAREILQATLAYDQGELMEDQLPSAAELARKHHLKLERVKKRLRVLRHESLIKIVTVGPKRYRFDWYALRFLPDDHPLHELFCQEDSPCFLETPL